MANYKMSLLCCGGTGCRASESVRIVERLREEIAAAGMDNDVQVVVTGCFGFCEQGPIVKVIPDNTFYTALRGSGHPEAYQRLEAHGLLSEAAPYSSA